MEGNLRPGLSVAQSCVFVSGPHFFMIAGNLMGVPSLPTRERGWRTLLRA